MAQSSNDNSPTGKWPAQAIPSTTPAPTSDEADANSPGRIVHDERGNAVYRIAIGSTSQMLKKLDLSNLQVEEETPANKEPEAKRRGSGYGPGYNPYDRTAPTRTPPPKKTSKD